MSRNNVVILVHIFCWLILAVGVLYNHPSDWGVSLPNEFWIKQTILLFMLMGVFYLNYSLLIPKLLIQKKVISYVFIIIAVVAFILYINSLINTALNLDQVLLNHFRKIYPHHDFDHDHHRNHDGIFGDVDTFVLGLTMLIIGLAITISFIQTWQQEVTLRQQLEQEKITTELTLLKAQINPHFFFNTLNTIYSYTLSNGDVARTAITNLSKMMRYVLYDAAGRQTPLSKEIAFIVEYTELMKLRISRKTTVLLQVQDQVKEIMIAPMLFLPFVENAFKHGVSGLQEGHIFIWIIQNDDSIELRVKNSVYESPRASEEQSNGIGILNTTRRLDLLYPGKYTLNYGRVGNDEYEVKLRLLL